MPKGLGVFSFNNLKISLHELYCEEFKYILPLEVTINNEKITNLIAVWAQDNNDPKKRYIGNVWCALNYYKDLVTIQPQYFTNWIRKSSIPITISNI